MTFERAMSDLSCAIGNLERAGVEDWEQRDRLSDQITRLMNIRQRFYDAKINALYAREVK